MKSITEIIKKKGGDPKMVPINSIKVDTRWWDRDEYNEDALERYRQLYEDGSESSILIQKDTKKLIAGFHRIAAAKDAKKDKILAIELDVPDSEIPLIQILENKNHGVPLSHTERDKAIIRAYVLGHKTQVEISELTGLSRVRITQIVSKAKEKLEGQENVSNVSAYIANIPETADERDKEALLIGYEDADKRTKVSSFKRIKIVEDQLAGFTQEETAEKFSISRPRVSQIFNEFRDEVTNYYSYKSENEAGHTKKETAENFSITEEQVDSLLSQVEPEPLNFKLPTTTWWPAYGLDKGQENYPGVSPVTLIKAILALFSRPGQHIVDPMAGSGALGIACSDMIGRTCELFDIEPQIESIKKHDLLNKKPLQPILPSVGKKPDLVFLDPPYSRVAEGKYTNHNDLASLEPNEFRLFMSRLFAKIGEEWHPCRIVVLMSNLHRDISTFYSDGYLIDTPSYLSVFLSSKKFRPLEHIVNEIGNPSSHDPLWVSRAEKGRWLLRKHIHIIVAETKMQ